MIKIALIEDNDAQAKELEDCLKRYAQENKEEFDIKRFKDAVNFLESFKDDCEIVFMDIELPYMNGMEAAARLRKISKQTVLIFVTNMAQYALKGYEVDALDYIIKPVEYAKLLFKLKKAVKIAKSGREVELAVAQTKGFIRISTKELLYIEVNGHSLTYHLFSETVRGTGSLTDLEENLKSRDFMRCNSCYLLNPRFIKAVNGLLVVMANGDELKISQPKRKTFLASLTDWLGQGNF